MKWKNKKWLMSLALNVVVLILFLICFYPTYETNDDNEINAIINGYYGQYEAHVTYMNILFTRILVFLNGIVRAVNWYALMQYAVIFASFWVITYLLMDTKGVAIGSFSAAFLLGIFGGQFYVLPQYTKTGGLATIAGGIALFAMARKEKKQEKALLIVVGIVLMLIGCMYRENVFQMCFLLLVPVGMVELLAALKRGWKAAIKQYAIVVVLFGGVFVTSLGMGAVMQVAHSETAEWDNYMTRRRLETELLDHFIPYYEDVPDLYNALGIDYEDRAFFETWNNADVEKFDIDALQTMAAAKEGYWVDPKVKAASFFSYGLPKILEISVFPYAAFLILLLVLSGNWQSLLMVLLEAGAVLIAYLYMYIDGRVFYNRVDVPLWLCVVMAFLFVWKSRKPIEIKMGNITAVCALAVIMLINSVTFSENLRMNYDIHQVEQNAEVLAMIAEDKEHLYLGVAGVVPTTNAESIFDRKPEGYLANYYELGGWMVGSPVTNQVLERYDVENVYRDCIDNPVVYIISGEDAGATEDYIQRNYNENAYFKRIKECNGYFVYQVCSK